MNSIVPNPCWNSETDSPTTKEQCPTNCLRMHDEWKKPTWFGAWVTSKYENCTHRIEQRKINLNKYLENNNVNQNK